MKILIPLIILIAIIQSTFFPASLVLALLIAKSYSNSDTADYYLALVGGISIGLFQSSNLGIQTIVLTLAVFLTHLYRKTPLSTNLFFFIPYTFGVILLLNVIQAVLRSGFIDWSVILFESVLCILIFSLIRALGLIGRENRTLRLKI